MTRNTILSRNACTTPEGETVAVCVRKCESAKNGTNFGVFVSEGCLADGSDIVWFDALGDAMKRAADEAWAVIAGM